MRRRGAMRRPRPVPGGLRRGRVALSIQGNTLRVLVARRRRVVTWAQVPFNPAFLREGFVADEQGMARVVENAFASNRIPRGRVAVAFPGFRSVVRVVRLPRAREIRPETQLPREARRLMAFNPEQQELFWTRLRRDRQEEVFLVVVAPRGPLRSLLDTLRRAGARPRRVELAPLCLARTVTLGHAVVANVEPDSIDIAILVDSTPVVVRSLWLGDEPLEQEQAAGRLAEELASTIGHYNDTHPEALLTPELPVQVGGSSVSEELPPAVAEETGQPVSPLVPPLRARDDFPAVAMSVPAGLLVER